MTENGQILIGPIVARSIKYLAMNAIVCDMTAWMYFAFSPLTTPIPAHQAREKVLQASGSAACARAIRSAGWWRGSEALARSVLALPPAREVPVHFLRAAAQREGARINTVVHQMSYEVPSGFLYEIQPPLGLDSLQIVGPEGYALLRAREVDEIHLAILLSLLCGQYLCMPHNGSVVYRKKAMTSMSAIETMSNQLTPTTRGIKRLKSVLPFVADKAYSPMETVIQLALCLPQKWGGCGLPIPQLNARIEVQGEHSYILGGSREIHPDGLWSSVHLGYEYDSHQEHDTNTEQIEKDRRRRDVMERLGYTMVVFDRATCRDELRRNLAFERITHFLGYPFDWGSTAQLRRRTLWARLMTKDLCW